MIKVIAFDLVGVLVKEKDINLPFEEDKIERMFGKNISDNDFLIAARSIISNQSLLVETTKAIIDKLYEIKEPELLNKLKGKYHNIKIIIATNHVSYIREYIKKSFDLNYLDDIFISAEMHEIKPDHTFYEHILNKLNIKSVEMLFLDDSQENVDGAHELKINTIKVNKDTKIFETISKWLEIDN